MHAEGTSQQSEARVNTRASHGLTNLRLRLARGHESNLVDTEGSVLIAAESVVPLGQEPALHRRRMRTRNCESEANVHGPPFVQVESEMARLVAPVLEVPADTLDATLEYIQSEETAAVRSRVCAVLTVRTVLPPFLIVSTPLPTYIARMRLLSASGCEMPHS